MQKVLYFLIGYITLATIMSMPLIHTDPPIDPMRHDHVKYRLGKPKNMGQRIPWPIK